MDNFFDQSENSMPRIGDQAPAFRSVTTQGTIYFPADYFGKWVILFSYPTDFDSVSTSEMMAFAMMHDDFKALNCELVGLSVNGLYSHISRSRSIKKKTEHKDRKDAEIKFPLIEDITMEVARNYGMIQPDERNAKSVRAVFFIDPECMIRSVIYYPQSLALNFDDLKRVIVALQTEDAFSVTTPAYWSTSDKVILPPAGSYGIAKERIETKKEGKKYSEWFFCTRELSEEKVMNVN